jgi:UDP-N-acetylglucosamine 4,6-dehydratase
MLEDKNIFVTGGAGTLGRAIAERRKREGWTGKFTVYSRDTHKHEEMARLYPDVNFVQGDIRNPETLFNTMVGHDICLHLAAAKVIPTSEMYSLDTMDNNINGSINVCIQAQRAGIEHVLGISTDKVCHPANAYGATKMLMEKAFHEFSRVQSDTQFHLVRYGNVLVSSGSVLEAWAKSKDAGLPIKITDPTMTRFWISPQQAVTLVINSLKLESGMTLIPKAKALSIGKLALYAIGKLALYGQDGGHEIEYVPLRPGEKMHETLLAVEEGFYAVESDDYIFLHPTTTTRVSAPLAPYSSDIAPELTPEELAELLRNE